MNQKFHFTCIATHNAQVPTLGILWNLVSREPMLPWVGIGVDKLRRWPLIPQCKPQAYGVSTTTPPSRSQLVQGVEPRHQLAACAAGAGRRV